MIELRIRPEFDDFFPRQIPTEIEIETTSGRRYRTEVVTPKGDPQNPMSATELIDKFRSLATRSIDSRASEKLVEKVGMLDRVDNVLELSHVFQKHFEIHD